MRFEKLLEDEQATLDVAKSFALALGEPSVVYLYGDLGAGKTCFSRGVIQALGYNGRVKSPTFTLVESYELETGQNIFHFDLYRLNDPEEAYFLGVDDYQQLAFLCLFEWPEKACATIPAADINVYLTYADVGRNIVIESNSERGSAVLKKL